MPSIGPDEGDDLVISSRGTPFWRLAAALVVACALGAGCQDDGGSGGGGSAAPGSTGSSGSFSALTYNVAGLPQGISSSQPYQYSPLISPKLNGYDLVLVQEDFTYHHLIAQDATHPFQSTPQTSTNGLVNDGLNRFSEHPFRFHQRETWIACHGSRSAGADCLSMKGFSFARHQLAPGVEVDVYNLHADAGGSTADEAARATQFDQLVSFMNGISAGRAVIVAGDTNLSASDPPDRAVLDDFVRDAGVHEVGRYLGNIPDHIDRFFFRDSADVDLEPLHWRVAGEFVTASGQDLSDHPAIHVDFSWRRIP